MLSVFLNHSSFIYVELVLCLAKFVFKSANTHTHTHVFFVCFLLNIISEFTQSPSNHPSESLISIVYNYGSNAKPSISTDNLIF